MQNLIGQVLLQRFRFASQISEDDLGIVYRGWDLKRNLPLVIKAIRGDVPYDESMICFKQGNLTLQSTTHPNILPFYGLYQSENIDFLVEGFVEGASLGDIIKQRAGQPLPVEEALIYLKAMDSSLGYMHGIGLVHSNVKPGNVMVNTQGEIILTDFGFARNSDTVMTTPGLLSNPTYLAPEQIRGEPVTYATDIYALGLLMFEMLTCQHPFLGRQAEIRAADGPAVERMRHAHLTQSPPDPRAINPALPAGLSQVIHTALAKDPKSRYSDIQEMLEIACAVSGTSPKQLPENFGTPGGAGATQVISAATQVVEQVTPTYVQPVVGTAAYAEPPSENVDYSQTAVVGEAPYYPVEEEKTSRPLWFWVLIGVIVVGALLSCGVIVAFGAPLVSDLFGEDTATPTATYTATVTSTLLPTDTPIVIPPTEIPTIPPLPPTELPIPPTEAPPIPTDTEVFIPSPTVLQTRFTVTIRNNLGYPIYAYRNGKLMGTDPIPPGKYIWYLNIPGGMHQFTFCADAQMTQCPHTIQVLVDRDLEIGVP